MAVRGIVGVSGRKTLIKIYCKLTMVHKKTRTIFGSGDSDKWHSTLNRLWEILDYSTPHALWVLYRLRPLACQFAYLKRRPIALAAATVKEGKAMRVEENAANQVPAKPEPYPPKSPLPSSNNLLPPFDTKPAEAFLSALAEPEDMAKFIDFVITHLLQRDHQSIFWGDRMLTIDKSAGFLLDPVFRLAFEQIRGAHKYDRYNSSVTIAWRLHTLVWAARAALALPEGDFVECGVFQGDMAWMIAEVTNFADTGRHFHLYDSFQGFDPSQTTEEDFPDLPGFLDFANAIYGAEGLWEGVQARFRHLEQHPIRLTAGKCSIVKSMPKTHSF